MENETTGKERDDRQNRGGEPLPFPENETTGKEREDRQNRGGEPLPFPENKTTGEEREDRQNRGGEPLPFLKIDVPEIDGWDFGFGNVDIDDVNESEDWWKPFFEFDNYSM